MLTNLIVINFKRFGHAEIELGDPVILIGPNNAGKTTALQALALWERGLKRWNEKRKGKKTPEKRPGVTINRRDLLSVPVPETNLLWRNLRVRDVRKAAGRTETKNIRIEIIVEGVTEDQEWKCGLEFDYANDESFYCRPLRLEQKAVALMPIPPQAEKVQLAFLPPMSGLFSNETRLDPGAIDVRIGEGRTAEVLRNLCYKLYTEDSRRWKDLVNYIESLFGSELEEPVYIPERGEIRMNYRENGIRLDLSASGRGLQQTLLLLAYMYANRGAVLLLDEPDAHLEIFRQRQIYQLLTDVARENSNQIIAASHSEVLLNEAAGRDVVVAFVGKPHRIDGQGSQVLKALKEIGFEHYYLAEQTGWVLYLEGSTDLAILRAFAKILGHQKALEVLERPFVHYVGNQLSETRKHYYGLREAVPHLKGIAIFDRLEDDMSAESHLSCLTWKRREIENYLCRPETLEAFAESSGQREAVGPLFAPNESKNRVEAMRNSISKIASAMEDLGHGSPWDPDTKVSDFFLTPLFKAYFKKLGILNVMAKKNFHELAYYVPKEKIDDEVKQKLDAIVDMASRAQPAIQEN